MSIKPKNSSKTSLSEEKSTRDLKEPYEKILPQEFYAVDPVTLSKNLLGKIIVRRIGDQVIKCKIVETEAYGGMEDKACHGYGGRFTERTKIMYMEGGHWYVFMLHGTSHCLAISSAPKGEPTVGSIRAVEIVEGYDYVVANRNMKNVSKSGKELTNGPGKMCAAMKIDKSFNACEVWKEGDLYLIEGDGEPFDIVVSKRINIDSAGEEAVNKPWRFYIKDNRFVSCKGVILGIINSLSGKSVKNDGEKTNIVDLASCQLFEKFKFLKRG